MIDLMRQFQRDLEALEPHHDPSRFDTFKQDRTKFKYAHTAFLFKVWQAGRENGKGT